LIHFGGEDKNWIISKSVTEEIMRISDYERNEIILQVSFLVETHCQKKRSLIGVYFKIRRIFEKTKLFI